MLTAGGVVSGGVKLAVTLLAAVIVTVQLPVPVHAPLQPVKVEPVVGMAVRVTIVPELYDALLPTATGLTVPLPVPAAVTLRVNVWSANAAVTLVAAFIVTVQGPVPLQPPPLHPVKVEPVAGLAVRVTGDP